MTSDEVEPASDEERTRHLVRHIRKHWGAPGPLAPTLRDLAVAIGDRDTARSNACLLVADLIAPPKGLST